MVTSPAVVGAAAVGSESAAKVRCSKCGYLVAHSCIDHQSVEVFHCLAKLREQLGMLYRLVCVGIETAELHIEDLPRDAEAAASTDDSGDGLQGKRELVVGEHFGLWVEILRRVRNASRASRQHCARQLSLRRDGAV